MTTAEIYNVFSGPKCQACGQWKRKNQGFCPSCYKRLPQLLRSSLWKNFGSGFEEAYQGCLSWFRLHPAPEKAEREAVQAEMFQKARAR